ncbi:MAG: hypothetical protein ACPGVJ_04020, partial [Mangrovicoccus sp.]
DATPAYQSYYDVVGKIYNTDGSVRVSDVILTGSQDTSSQSEPSLLSFGDDLLVVWRGNGPGDNDGVFARLLDANGNELVAPFLVNDQLTSGAQYHPTALDLGNGRFVIAWAGGQVGDGDGVAYQIYETSGSPVSAITKIGNVELVNTDTYSTDAGPQLISDGAGGFVIAWYDYSYQNAESPAANYTYGTFLREITYDGGLDTYSKGTVTQINEQTAGNQYSPQLTMLANGTVATVWYSENTAPAGDGSGNGVFLRLLGTPGSLAGVNQAPEIAGLPSELSFAENAGPQLLDPGMAAALADSDSTDFGGGKLVFGHSVMSDLEGGFGPLSGRDQHVLGIQSTGSGAGEIEVIGSEVFYGGTKIGDITSSGTAGSNLEVALLAAADLPAVEALIEALTYDNISDVPGSQTTLFVALEQADGVSSMPHQILVTTEAEADLIGYDVSDPAVVNTLFQGTQYQPAVAVLNAGAGDLGYVIVWEDHQGHDGSGYGVYGQRYGMDGAEIGDQFLINDNTSGSQYEPEITGLSDGGFVVTYRSDATSTGDYRDVFLRRYDQFGVAQGPAINLTNAQFGNSYEFEADVLALASGGWVVTWRSDTNGSGTGDVYAQIFDAAGVGGAIFQVNVANIGYQWDIRAAQLTSGDIVFTYVVATDAGSGQGDGSAYGVYQRRYSETGVADPAGEQQVNTWTTNDQSYPEILALANGTYVITWQSWAQDGSNWGLYAQIFDASGAPLGSEFLINARTSDDQFQLTMTALADGGFAVGWYDQNSSPAGSRYDVWAQIYNADGSRRDEQILITPENYSAQHQPVFASFEQGGFVAVYTDDS